MTDERDEFSRVMDIEVEPLADDSLDSVAGGTGNCTHCCTGGSCPAPFMCPSLEQDEQAER